MVMIVESFCRAATEILTINGETFFALLTKQLLSYGIFKKHFCKER